MIDLPLTTAELRGMALPVRSVMRPAPGCTVVVDWDQHPSAWQRHAVERFIPEYVIHAGIDD